MEEKTLIYPTESVSKVIGRGGSNIKLVRMQSGARVDTDRNMGSGLSNQQAIIFSGTTQQVADAIAMVKELVASDTDTQGVRATPEQPLYEKTLEFPRESVSRIIGTGGSNIKRIRAESGCRVDTDRNAIQGNRQKIRLQGTEAQVEAAVALVTQVAESEEEAPAKSANNLGVNGVALVEEMLVFPRETCSRVIGAGGSTIRRIREQSGAQVNTDRTTEGIPSGQQSIRFNGTFEQVESMGRHMLTEA